MREGVERGRTVVFHLEGCVHLWRIHLIRIWKRRRRRIEMTGKKWERWEGEMGMKEEKGNGECNERC